MTVPSVTPWTNSAKPSFADSPSFAHSATPFFMPASICPVFAPDLSNCASMAIASSVENPSSLKVVALAFTSLASLPTSTPACWPATVSLSSMSPYWSALMPALFIILATSWMALVASWPVTLAYFMAASDAPSSCSPCRPKRVFSSPTALPMRERQLV